MSLFCEPGRTASGPEGPPGRVEPGPGVVKLFADVGVSAIVASLVRREIQVRPAVHSGNFGENVQPLCRPPVPSVGTVRGSARGRWDAPTSSAPGHGSDTTHLNLGAECAIAV